MYSKYLNTHKHKSEWERERDPEYRDNAKGSWARASQAFVLTGCWKWKWSSLQMGAMLHTSAFSSSGFTTSMQLPLQQQPTHSINLHSDQNALNPDSPINEKIVKEKRKKWLFVIVVLVPCWVIPIFPNNYIIPSTGLNKGSMPIYHTLTTHSCPPKTATSVLET